MRILRILHEVPPQGKHPCFCDAVKSNNSSRNSSLSLFVEDPPTLLHPTHKDSDSLFFRSNPLITETGRLTYSGIGFDRIRLHRSLFFGDVKIGG
jgi:hypothetical protein